MFATSFLLAYHGCEKKVGEAILAGGRAIMAIAGILFFHEVLSWQRLCGIVLAIVGLSLPAQIM